jgi:hypothetical protein
MSTEALRGAFRLFVGDSSSDSDLFTNESSEYTDEDDVPMDVGTMTDTPARMCCIYGDILVAFRQQSSGLFVRSIEGLEVELGLTLHAEGGHYVEFFSVLPKTVLADNIVTYLKENGLKLRLNRPDAMEFGGISQLTEMTDPDGVKVKEFQRSGSAFHRLPKPFKWEKGILHDRAPCWVHSSVSSFLWSDTGRENWIAFIENATDIRLPPDYVQVSLEFGSQQWPEGVGMETILEFSRPYMSRLTMLILTLEEFTHLVKIADPQVNNIMGTRKTFENALVSLRTMLECQTIVVLIDKQASLAVVAIHTVAGIAWSKPVTGVSERILMGRVITAFIRTPAIKTQADLQKSVNGICGGDSPVVPVSDLVRTGSRISS